MSIHCEDDQYVQSRCVLNTWNPPETAYRYNAPVSVRFHFYYDQDRTAMPLSVAPPPNVI